MSQFVIVVGDKTSHGGVVISGSPETTVDGKPVTRITDKATCPCRGHGGVTVIISGDPTCIIDGQPVARHGDKTACGATLLSSQVRTSVDAGGGGAAGGSNAGSKSERRADGGTGQPTVTDSASKPEVVEEVFDEQFVLRDRDGDPMASIFYTIRRANGELIHGVTDQAGKTSRVKTDSAEMLEVFLGHIREQA